MPSSTAANRREQLRRQQEAQARQKRTYRIVGVAAAVLALVLIGVFVAVLVQTRGGTGGTTGQAVTPPNANADGTAIVVNSTPAPEGAPVVTLYLDYQCPNCRTFEDTFGDMLEESANAGDWTLQNSTMVFMDQNLSNTASTRAAIGAACSAVSGHYNEYHRNVYANQALSEVRGSEGFSDALLRDELPAQVGITGDDLTAFQACYDNRSTSGFVAAVDKAAYAAGVTGTPTLAVNGEVLDLSKLTNPTPEGLREYILANA